MALDDDIRLLSSVRLFSELTAEQLRLLAFGSETVELEEGEELYREDEEADGAYVVSSGRVALTRKRGGQARVVSVCQPGEILGEMALITETRRLTGAVAETPATVVRLNRGLFRRILEEYPEVAVRLHARLSRQLHELLRRIQEIAPRFS